MSSIVCSILGRNSIVLTILSPVILIFSLPPKYPIVRPDLKLECEWMDEELISYVDVKLADVCNENLGIGVLFFCCEMIAEIVKSKACEWTEICLDNAVYKLKNNLTGGELLRRVAESSAQSQEYLFQSGCYDCEVCFENKTGRQCILFMPCRHIFCRECVSAFFLEILNSQEVRTLSCLAAECKSSASQQTVLDLVGQEQFERYERLLLDRALARMDDVVPCPRKICQKPVLISNSCGMCGYSFCVQCFRAYHGVDGCHFNNADKKQLITKWNTAGEEERIQMARRFGGVRNLQKLIDAMLSERWIDENSKSCPRCRIRIEKTDGCNKMQCSKCGAMFCWLCDCLLDRNNPYGHFSAEGGNCANRLFDGMIAFEIGDAADFEVGWEDVIDDENDKNMGGWKLEAMRFALLVTFPVASFWFFNQPSLFKVFMKNFMVPDNREGDAALLQFKEELRARRRKREYETLLREELAYEEARRLSGNS
ncbi:IBR domain protein [Dictyocaulus viviparus]|uniref:RBR-type E3 ubiquitin transferase n=1 Tax=Dictyocaulus viviparus TaxID=29172 RepID=A0A0D8XTZ7_DICVI|nr:IBR domain protein [Dictyocaulus viviparus]